jgi:hypothetical protein
MSTCKLSQPAAPSGKLVSRGIAPSVSVPGRTGLASILFQPRASTNPTADRSIRLVRMFATFT